MVLGQEQKRWWDWGRSGGGGGGGGGAGAGAEEVVELGFTCGRLGDASLAWALVSNL